MLKSLALNESISTEAKGVMLKSKFQKLQNHLPNTSESMIFEMTLSPTT